MEFPSDVSKDIVVRFSTVAGDEKKFISNLADEDKAGLISLVEKCLANTTWRTSDAAHEKFLGKAIQKLSDLSERGALKPEQRSKLIGILLAPQSGADKLVRSYWTERVTVKTQDGVEKAPMVALASHSAALRALLMSGMREQMTGEIAFPSLSEDSFQALQNILKGDTNAIYLLTPENVRGLLDFCTQYEITEPLQQIDAYLITYMTPEDALDTYLTAKLYGRQDVVEKSLELFRANYNPEDNKELAVWAKENNATEVRQHIETQALDILYKIIPKALSYCKGENKADELFDRYHLDTDNANKTWTSVLKDLAQDPFSVASLKKLEEGPRVFLGLRDQAEIGQLRPALDTIAQLGTLHTLGEVGKLEPQEASALLRLLQDAGVSYECVNLSGAVDVDLLISYLPSNPSTITELDLSHTSGLDQASLERLVQNHPHISVLKLPSGAHFTDLSCMSRLKKLTDLDCSGQPIPGDQVIAIASGCPNLVHLNISRSYLQKAISQPEKVLKALADSCPNLRGLDMGHCFKKLSDSAITQLARLSLFDLGIAGVQIDNAAVLAEALRGMRSLESLDLSWLQGFDACVLDSVSANCPKCKWLNLDGIKNLTYKALNTLIRTHGAQIESLNLSGCKDIDDKKAKKLVENLPKIKSFNLNDCSLSANVIHSFIGLKNLDKLGLGWMTTELDEDSREALIQLLSENSSLTSLNLTDAGELGNNVMKAIGQCKGLKCLNIAGCRITSEGVRIQKMPTLKNLEVLDVSGSDIKVDSLLKVVRGARHLNSLSINNLNQLSTPVAQDMVKRDLPNLEYLSMNWVPSGEFSSMFVYRGILGRINMPKLEDLSLQGHYLSENEHFMLVDPDSDNFRNLRFLDLRNAKIDKKYLLKYTKHLDFVKL